jgi:hypothetical protein
LRPLVSRDSCNRVRVLFLPLTPAQGGRQLWEDIYVFNAVATQIRARTRPNYKYHRELAKLLVQGVDTTIQRGDISTVLSMNGALVDALLGLVEVTGPDERSPTIINTSWTLESSFGSPSFGDTSTALIVAAAGNRDYDALHRSVALVMYADDIPIRVLGVVNVNPQGQRTCNTSYFEGSTRAANTGSIVGYRGGLKQGAGGCGSSFAAPRVGWSIAFWVSQLDANERTAWYPRLLRMLEAMPPLPGGRLERSFSIDRLRDPQP